MTITKDVQEVIVSALMKSSYLFSICKTEMSDGYFSDPACKVIYKSIESYYSKYQAIPRLNELLIQIDDSYYPTVGVDLSEVKDTCQKLWNYPEPEEAFIRDKITDFVRKIRSASALKEFIEAVKLNPNLESDEIVTKLVKALEVSLSTTKVFMMNDPDQVKEARISAVGTDQTKIVRSFIDSLNKSLMFGGYQPGTVNLVPMSPPGCFTGDTKLFTLDGKVHTFQELYDNKVSPSIYGCAPTGEIKVGLSDSVYLSKYTDSLVEVEIDNKYTIRCTEDHPFMLRNGKYKRADELTKYDSLMPIKKEYRLLERAGGTLVDAQKGYECVTNGNSEYVYTHRLSAELIVKPDGTSHIHHKDHNKLNNSPDNLVWLSPKDHNKLHYEYNFKNNESFREGVLSGRIKKGEHKSKETEFTSSEIRAKNLENWKDSEYREKMRKVSIKNGSNSYMVNNLNYTKEFQDKTQRCKILNFINRILLEFPEETISEERYEALVSRSKAKRKIWLNCIKKYFDCSFDNVVELARNYNHKVTNIKHIKLDNPVPVYGVVDAKPFGNYAISLNDTEGLFVHNTGKSMFLINEGKYAAEQGFDVLHIFIGDMVEYDGFVRYLSCISGTPMQSLAMLPPDKQMEVVNVCNQQYNNIFDRIFIVAYPSLSLTVENLMEDIARFEKQLEKDFGMIIIDYPDNLIQEGVSLYTDGGTLYSSLEKLSRLTQSVVLVASQPQKAYWNHEIIPLEAASDSSKKQMAVDILLSMNTASRGAPFGSMLLAKARKGSVGKVFRFKTEFEKCHMEEIDEATYNAMRSQFGIK